MYHKYNKSILVFWEINCHPKLDFWIKSPKRVQQFFSNRGRKCWTQYKCKIFNGVGATDAENDIGGGDSYDEVDMDDDDDMDTGQV